MKKDKTRLEFVRKHDSSSQSVPHQTSWNGNAGPQASSQISGTVTCRLVVQFSVRSDSVTPWTAAHQAPLSMGFSRQECWSGLPFPLPGDLDPGIQPESPALAGGFFTAEPAGKPNRWAENSSSCFSSPNGELLISAKIWESVFCRKSWPYLEQVNPRTAWRGKRLDHRPVPSSYLPRLSRWFAPCCEVTLWRMCRLGQILLFCLFWFSKAWNPIQCIFQLFIFCNLSLHCKLHNLRREKDIIHGWFSGGLEKNTPKCKRGKICRLLPCISYTYLDMLNHF